MSQEEMVLAHLKAGKSISPIEALNLYGCFRLAAIIHQLRDKYEIETLDGESVRDGKKKHFAIYRLSNIKKEVQPTFEFNK